MLDGFAKIVNRSTLPYMLQTPELLNRAFDEEHRSMLHTSQQPGQIPVLSTHTPLRSWRLDQRWTPRYLFSCDFLLLCSPCFYCNYYNIYLLTHRLARAGLLPLARMIQATEEDVVAQPAHGEPAHVERSRGTEKTTREGCMGAN